MSVQNSSPDQQDDLEPGRVFERYVETDPSICNSCFRRPLPERTAGTDVESKGVHEDGSTHSALYHWETEDVCPHCGSMSLSAPDETLSVEVARARTVPLSRRLRERSIPHDLGLLVWFVATAKRRSGIHTKDRDIAARGVEFAVADDRL